MRRTVRGSNPSEGEVFRTRPDRPWGPPSLLCNGYRVFPGGKKRPGREGNPSPLLVPRAIPLFPLWVIRHLQSLSACTRVHFKNLYLLLMWQLLHCKKFYDNDRRIISYYSFFNAADFWCDVSYII